jgi:hypothetical protein
MGSAVTSRPSNAGGERQTREVTVPAGATLLETSIGNPGDPGADLDLFVYLNGVLVGQSAGGTANESISIGHPAAGTYQVVVDGYSVPAGTTAFDYRDVFYSQTLGSVSTPAGTTLLANGATATVTGTVVATAAAEPGRELFGAVSIVTDTGAVVGKGNLSIDSVSSTGPGS